MKKISIATALVFILMSTNAQTRSLFLRHDTTILLASACNWLIPPLPAPKSTNTTPLTLSNQQNTVSEWFLSSINKGKFKAVDPFTEKPIPSGQIYTWGMPADTIAVYDLKMEKESYKVVVNEIQPEMIDRLRIQQDWWLDASTGKIFSRINWVELMIDVNGPSGMNLGQRPFCRIYY
jgi:hypothetical protein